MAKCRFHLQLEPHLEALSRKEYQQNETCFKKRSETEVVLSWLPGPPCLTPWSSGDPRRCAEYYYEADPETEENYADSKKMLREARRKLKENRRRKKNRKRIRKARLEKDFLSPFARQPALARGSPLLLCKCQQQYVLLPEDRRCHPQLSVLRAPFYNLTINRLDTMPGDRVSCIKANW